jgi:hypothetical protein
LATLRDTATAKLEQKVAARQELQAEMERVAGFVAPAARGQPAAAAERATGIPSGPNWPGSAAAPRRFG